MTKKAFSDFMRRPVDELDRLQKPARTPQKASTKKSSPNQKGCPGNDGKEHVYTHILTIYRYGDGSVKEWHHWGPCMGCEHVHRNRKRSDKPVGVPDKIETFVYTRPSIWHGWDI